MGENGGPSLRQKEKRRSAKSDVSKVSFPDTGKITNQEKQEEKPLIQELAKGLKKIVRTQKNQYRQYVVHRTVSNNSSIKYCWALLCK